MGNYHKITVLQIIKKLHYNKFILNFKIYTNTIKIQYEWRNKYRSVSFVWSLWILVLCIAFCVCSI